MEPVLSAMTDLEIVSLTLIGEARGEPIEGIVGCGFVIKNRLTALGSRYKNYADVCLADEQFSCWNPDDANQGMLLDLAIRMLHNEPIVDPYFVQCIFIAEGIVNSKLFDNTKGARFYMVSTLLNSLKCPSWAKLRKNELVKGNHTFFSLV